MCGEKNKINCQCDGNCDCGTILPNGKISCDNCGWKAPERYNALTGNYVCPSCRTESSYSSNNVKSNNNKMNNNENNFTQGLVGLGAVNAGFLNWSEDPLGKRNGEGESGFAGLSQQVVGYATGIGQGFMLDPFNKGGVQESGFDKKVQKFAMGNQGFMLNPFESGFGEDMSDDDKKWAAIFSDATKEFDVAENNNEESGAFGDKLKGFMSSFTPTGILVRQVWSSKYCKALGYMRSADKNGFKKCMAATKINFVQAKAGKWKYPAAPEGVESNPSPEELAAASAKYVAAMSPEQKSITTNQAVGEDAQILGQGQAVPKSNMMMYVIIGVVVLAIIIAIVIMMRRKAAKAA